MIFNPYEENNSIYDIVHKYLETSALLCHVHIRIPIPIIDPFKRYYKYVNESPDPTPMHTKLCAHMGFKGEIFYLKNSIKGLYLFSDTFYTMLLPSIVILIFFYHIWYGIKTIIIDYIQDKDLLEYTYYCIGWFMLFFVYSIFAFILHRAGIIHNTDFFVTAEKLKRLADIEEIVLKYVEHVKKLHEEEGYIAHFLRYIGWMEKLPEIPNIHTSAIPACYFDVLNKLEKLGKLDELDKL